MVTVTCRNCGKQFEREVSEYNRNVREGTPVFCDNRCSGLWMETRKRGKYTPFRYYIRASKKRRKPGYNIDLPYLKSIWEKQKGICPLTGWKLNLPSSVHGFGGREPRNASLDRIDNNLGYTKGNVRFIALIANYARLIWNDDAVIDFAQAVVSHKNK